METFIVLAVGGLIGWFGRGEFDDYRAEKLAEKAAKRVERAAELARGSDSEK